MDNASNKASLIVSVYDKSQELELILKALAAQSYKGFEVIIAEDGRSHAIDDTVNNFKGLTSPITHITQDDRGFRKNKILNEAVRNSKTGYLIFIDGDCIPHHDFIKAHVENMKENTVLCGRRVALGKKLTDEILNNSAKYEGNNLRKIIDSLSGKEGSTKNAEEGLIIKNKLLRKIITGKDTHILGCNFSIERSLLLKINGFDENYIGPGLGEDSDIEFRLRLIGAEFKSIRNLAVQYHLYHGKTVEAKTNFEYFAKVKQEKNYFAKNGLIKVQ